MSNIIKCIDRRFAVKNLGISCLALTFMVARYHETHTIFLNRSIWTYGFVVKASSRHYAVSGLAAVICYKISYLISWGRRIFSLEAGNHRQQEIQTQAYPTTSSRTSWQKGSFKIFDMIGFKIFDMIFFGSVPDITIRTHKISFPKSVLHQSSAPPPYRRIHQTYMSCTSESRRLSSSDNSCIWK